MKLVTMMVSILLYHILLSSHATQMVLMAPFSSVSPGTRLEHMIKILILVEGVSPLICAKITSL
jgi:hypothetical protein